MELGIKARDIMNEDFLLLDSSLTLETCIKKIGKEEACIIIDNGFLHSILGYDDLLKVFLNRKNKNIKLKDIGRKNFAVVSSDADVTEIINIMKKGIDFIIVKEKNFLGLITKKEVAEINQLLFDEIRVAVF